MKTTHPTDQHAAAHSRGTAPHRRRWIARSRAAALAAVALGLLLWAKFLLVTNHPRTAIADPSTPPRSVQPQRPAHAAAPADEPPHGSR